MRVVNVPVLLCAVGFKGLYQLVFDLQATPACIPTHVLGNVPPSEQRTQDLFCLLGSFPEEVGEKGANSGFH